MDQQMPKPDPPLGAPASPLEPAAVPIVASSPAVAASANSQPASDLAKAKLEGRRAVGIALIAGAFPSIFAIAGAAWALIDKRLSNNLIWLGIFGAIVLLLASIYCGGRGISALSDSSKGKPSWFNRQALSGLAGLLCAVLVFGIWIVAMPSKSSSEIEALRKQFGEMTGRLAVAEELQKRTESDVVALRAEVAKNAQQAQHAQNQQLRQPKLTKPRHP